jgi:long-chain acyl-CoA synthetase
MGKYMFIDFLLRNFGQHPANSAVIWNDETLSYGKLKGKVEFWQTELHRLKVPKGAVVGLEGDFSPNGIGLFLALTNHACIIVPQSNTNFKDRERKDKIAEVEFYFRIDSSDQVTFEPKQVNATHELYLRLRSLEHPGLLLFSSGTSGEPKAALHDFVFLLEKFKTVRKPYCTLNFLLFDHWGGLNTLLHTIANGGTIVSVRDRSPESVCRMIESYKVELLPTTPTFINLLLLRGAHKDFDLSSLKVISYGAEPMPQGTLDRLSQTFPAIKLQQTYGLIEVGVLRSQSQGNGSLWVRIGGEGYQTRVVDGMLQVQTKSTILGYLNALSPITEDGWFMTGDAVEVDGEFFKILGRKSELINVGGEKVFPTEVENVIQQMENVVEVTVFGEKNPLIGSIVCAKVLLREPEPLAEFSVRLKQFCATRLERFKVPVKVRLEEVHLHNDRFKKMRANTDKYASGETSYC